jgi:hypothetical protein
VSIVDIIEFKKEEKEMSIVEVEEDVYCLYVDHNLKGSYSAEELKHILVKE